MWISFWNLNTTFFISIRLKFFQNYNTNFLCIKILDSLTDHFLRRFGKTWRQIVLWASSMQIIYNETKHLPLSSIKHHVAYFLLWHPSLPSCCLLSFLGHVYSLGLWCCVFTTMALNVVGDAFFWWELVTKSL